MVNSVLSVASGVSAVLTVSIGIGTTIPALHEEPLSFIEEVDRRLYRAKQNDRNCIVDSA